MLSDREIREMGGGSAEGPQWTPRAADCLTAPQALSKAEHDSLFGSRAGSPECCDRKPKIDTA